MTAGPEERLDRLERMFAEAHRARPDVPVGDDWVRTVMRDIRLDAATHPSVSTLIWIEPLVWRTAAVAAIAAVLFTGFVAAYAGGQSDQVTALWLEEFDGGPALLDD